jgi:hypothetical protein
MSLAAIRAESASRASRRASIAELTTQLSQVQEAYRAIQAEAAASETRLELSAVHPGIPVQRVPLAGKPKVAQTNALTAGELHDVKRRELSNLTLEMIMGLGMKQILALRGSFESHGGVVSISQFVAIMASHLDVAKLKLATPDMLIKSLVELFDSMDLDGPWKWGGESAFLRFHKLMSISLLAFLLR